MATNDPDHSLNPSALPLPAAAALLSRAGGQTVTVEQLEDDVDDGAPTNVDGTLNLVHYAAWLIQEMAQSGD